MFSGVKHWEVKHDGIRTRSLLFGKIVAFVDAPVATVVATKTMALPKNVHKGKKNTSYNKLNRKLWSH